ncbi:unnamed protein product [Parnassius mnemosyne]|uniref:Reverse transcriptase n=1 Tax=Parnassius mnemosyne TaxID=213953 RepID=A0AAV1K9K9_9NEOP
MEIPCQKWEIEHVNRMGKKSGKVRPVVVTITTTSRRIEILKKKKSLEGTNIYLKEDFPPSVLQKRKELQEDLKRERESGKRVALRYDKIVTLKARVSEVHTPTERNINKRFMSKSPEETVNETTKEYDNEKTKQVPKRNKSHTITSFLRPSQLNLNNRAIATVNAEVQNQYDKLEQELQEFLKQLPRKKKHVNRYINEETKDLLEQRKGLYMKKRTKELKCEITRISKKINRNITQQKRRIRQRTFEKFIGKTGALRKAYKELSDKAEWTEKLRNKQGIVQSRRPDIINEATQFYKKLYTTTDGSCSLLCEKPGEYNRVNANIEIPIILRSEIEHAIKSQKDDKSPGSDNIANEVLKALTATLLEPLQTLFNNILRTETTPDQWSKSTNILLFK